MSKKRLGYNVALHDYSPAYRAYVALDRMPKNATNFETDNGYPVVFLGELQCRAECPETLICGNKFSQVSGLVHHLERVHGALKAHRPKSKLGASSLKELRKAAELYVGLMKYEDYPGHNAERQPEVETLQASSKATGKKRRIEVQEEEGEVEEGLSRPVKKAKKDRASKEEAWELAFRSSRS
ncbi:hypothetical protein LTR36_010272 [Oleoguttula mirabilis]|uniref:C2H2-type domain-containing protein n=1 Tax=Oleoguttula mirabilis TaxID=1507867 RepID=A0AAV9J583_9PEZI|nr:hypothetical protein LTR36_010272 [Oleoguttula mirabilis]